MPRITHVVHFKSLTVYCAIVQLKAVEKTQWERLHVAASHKTSSNFFYFLFLSVETHSYFTVSLVPRGLPKGAGLRRSIPPHHRKEGLRGTASNTVKGTGRFFALEALFSGCLRWNRSVPVLTSPKVCVWRSLGFFLAPVRSQCTGRWAWNIGPKATLNVRL